MPEGKVLLHAEGSAEREAPPVFREVRHARAASGSRAPVERRVAVQRQQAARRTQSCDRFRKLGLAIAVDAGDADDLSAPDVEGDAAKGRQSPLGRAGQLAGAQRDPGLRRHR